MTETYRNIRPDDFDDLSILAQDWLVVRQLGGWNWPYDPDQIRERSQPYTKDDGFVWAICRDDRLIGTVGVIRGDLGYMLHPDFHRQGVMTRAATSAVDKAFGATDHPHLTATVWHDNAASFGLLKSLGFVHWQTRFEHARARGLPTLTFHSRLTRADWQRLSAPAQ